MTRCLSIIFALCTLAVDALARNHRHMHLHRAASCDFGISTPSDFPTSVMSQWCNMITTELYTLNITEDPTVLIPHIQALYRQAGISADPTSALANVQQIAQDPQARAALQAMKAAYPTTGSPDLSEDAIKRVYANAIRAASDETQVPRDILVKVISAESKGHPFVCK